jgi:IclR family transcriptional regulator, acetate operon repressor
VDNALRLLMLFRDTPRVRLSEASGHLGVAHSTAHRLMAMLAYHGFVRQEPGSRAYVAGPALVEIGLAAVRELDIRLHARPVLESLAASLRETVHLAVLEGGNVRYLDAVESPHALRVASRTGSALAANCTRRVPSATPAAAISVSGPVSRMTGPAIEKIAAKLRERAAELASLI